MKIKITKNSFTEFPYGNLSKENRAFLNGCNAGDVFEGAVRHNMNFYKLPNGHLVHIYNAAELE